jgi:hypothetical protein
LKKSQKVNALYIPVDIYFQLTSKDHNSELHASFIMKNDGTTYQEFEKEANKDPEKSYPPVKFGGFEWLEGW